MLDPYQATARSIQILALQLLSLLQRRPEKMTERDQDTLIQCAGLLLGMERSAKVARGEPSPGLTREDVDLHLFYARAESTILGMIPGTMSFDQLLSWAAVILETAHKQQSLSTITGGEQELICKMFSALKAPADSEVLKAEDRTRFRRIVDFWI